MVTALMTLGEGTITKLQAHYIGMAAEAAFTDIQRRLSIEAILNIATDMKSAERGGLAVCLILLCKLLAHAQLRHGSHVG